MTETMKPFEILLVEDTPSDALLMKQAFKDTRNPLNITVVEDGEIAMQLLFQEAEFSEHPTPDLVLLDLNIPKIEGREILRKIKANRKLKHIPVIVLSGSQSTKDIEEVYGLHASSYVVKPLDFDQLKNIVKAIDNYWLSIVRLARKDNKP